VGLLALGSLASLTQAADFACPAGDVACLIAAINTANANGAVNTITLEAGTYTLTAVDNDTDGPNGLPSITSPLTLQGAGAASTILRREPFLSSATFRLLHVAPSGDVQVESLTLTGGVALSDDGGGLWNAGTVRLRDCAISGNATDFGAGAGIFNRGTLHVTHSTITGNSTTTNGGSGGGIYNGGTVTLTQSTIANSTAEFVGGGIANAGSLTVTNSTIRSNRSSRGGGIDNGNAGVVVLTNSTISGNNAFGSPKFMGQPGGGGIANRDTGAVFVLNSTITENTTSGIGGGIFGNGLMALANTVLARNLGISPPEDCAGAVVSLGSNLVGDPGNCDIQLQASDLTGDPGLDTFTDNGTPGNGHFPLLPTSQAIDAGNDALCPRVDQLGQRRIGRCDIGAIRFLDGIDRQHEDDPATTAQTSQ
jgi:hypothetical protein